MDVLISLVDSRFSVLKTDLTETSVELCQHHRGGGGELEGMEFENGGAKELENGSCDPQKNGMHWHRTTFQRDLVTPSNLSSLCLALWVRCLRSRLCVFGVLSSRCNSWKTTSLQGSNCLLPADVLRKMSGTGTGQMFNSTGVPAFNSHAPRNFLWVPWGSTIWASRRAAEALRSVDLNPQSAKPATASSAFQASFD